MTTLTNEELAEIISQQLPRLLAEEPDLKVPLYRLFLESFAEKGEVGRLRQDLTDFRVEVQNSFKQVDQRFEGLEQRITEGFKNVERQIDRLGQRWGIRNESLFRATMADLLEESFGVKVQRRSIAGEEFDVIISNGDHILVEIAASVRRNIRERLERKRELYIEETGIVPARFILAVASIHSRRAQDLREAGFTVIEPDEDELEPEPEA